MYLSLEDYRRRMLGCWIGKNVGGTLGMPMEWNRQKNEVGYYTHKMTGEPLPNDDLDIQVLWLLALEDKGLDVDSKDLGQYFNELMIFTHGEYGIAKTNLRAGLQPPVAGTHNNEFKDSCGSFIRSEIWACLFPGHPELAARYAVEDAMIDHGNGEGVYAEVFVAAMESACFFERDLEKLVEIGLSYIPEDCAVARAVRHGAACAKAGMSKEEARKVMLDNWIGHIEWHYISPEDEAAGYKEGKMGWDVPSNMFITVYSMLACAGDFDQSICTAVYFGEDTDCTAGTIAAMYGLMYGVDCIDEKWITPIGRGIKTVSLDPFRLYGRIPATIDEMSERVEKLFVKAVEHFHLDIQFEAEGAGEVPDFHARDYFRNLYDDLNVVRYAFPYLTVRLDYCGEPVLQPGVPKKLRLVLSNSDKYVSADRVQVHLYAQDEVQVLPGKDQVAFLTMPHHGGGVRAVEYEVLVEQLTRPVYRFVAELTFEENKKGMTHCVPFVLLNEGGEHIPTVWEKKPERYPVPNQPRQ